MRNLLNYLVPTLLIVSAVVGFAGGYASSRIQTPDYVAKFEELSARLDKLVEDSRRLKNSAEKLERDSGKLMSTISDELRRVVEEATKTSR
ncbi:hypothetical protein A3K73_08250 [Candidatus Pacearchaeota archaeon RBG_13_36_9]|nr:MAG: hypothetical protein A3K73_08250 [Candidatus Pacearchaeota archaeon RBG_13_36_9]